MIVECIAIIFVEPEIDLGSVPQRHRVRMTELEFLQAENARLRVSVEKGPAEPGAVSGSRRKGGAR
jgi:hypothetical protein